MLRASKIQESVIYAYKEIIGIPFEPSDQRRFAAELNNLVANEGPELFWRNPNDAMAANDFCGSLSSAGQDRLLP